MLNPQSSQGIFIKRATLDLWAMLQIGVTAGFSLFMSLFIGFLYEEMHTLGTMMDPDPELTKDTVLQNIAIKSGTAFVAAILIAIAIYYVSNWTVLEKEPERRHLFSRNTALLCWLVMLFFIVFVSGDCYLKYGAPAPWPEP